MKNNIAFLLTFVLILSLTSCGSKSMSTSETVDSTIEIQTETASIQDAESMQTEDSSAPAGTEPDLADIEAAILDKLQITDSADIPAERLMDLYGLDSADYTQESCFVTMAGIFPHEVVMLKAVDEAAAERLAEKLESRLNEVRNQSASYDAENYALAQACTVDMDGLYISMFLSPDHDIMREVFKSFFNEG